MFSSIRLRLTLWYVLAFGVLLIGFSTYLYSSLADDLRKQFDVSLSRTAQAMANYFTEFAERRNIVGGARETVQESRFGDLSSAIFHKGQLLASNGKNFDSTNLMRILLPQSKTSDDPVFLTQSKPNRRLAALMFQAAGENYTVVVAESLDQLDYQLSQIRKTIFFALPTALILAAAGGYLLARKSLKPIVDISEQAEHMSAKNLHERLKITSQDELGRLTGVINALLSRLDSSFRIMREFMADAAHELRTPLAIIHGESDVSLSRPRTPEEYQESLSVIRDNCKRLVHIVSDMLALTRADSGEQPLRREELYLNDLVEGCCRSAQALAVVKGVRLTYETAHDVSFYGDEELLKRMTMNLIDNAIRYTPEGGLVSVKVQREDQNVRLVVHDTGIGIPADCVNRVFDRFYRVAKSRARADGGSGLGLSIVKLAAQAHHGTAEVSSELGCGSTFTISLPLGQV